MESIEHSRPDSAAHLERRYVALLKGALTFGLWQPPPVPLIGLRRTRFRRFIIDIVERIFSYTPFRLVYQRRYTATDIEEGRTWPEYADTMIGMKRLDQLEIAVETILREEVEGDLLEAGVWRGGACIFMRALLMIKGIEDRRVIAADSFEGFPFPNLDRFPIDLRYAKRRGGLISVSLDSVSLDEVRSNFQKYGLLDEQVVFVKGFFEESLPRADIGQLSILRLDADMYGSTIVALEHLYPRLSSGGFCIVDDYALVECRQAVNDYRSRHGITEAITRIDHTGVFWRKR